MPDPKLLLLDHLLLFVLIDLLHLGCLGQVLVLDFLLNCLQTLLVNVLHSDALVGSEVHDRHVPQHSETPSQSDILRADYVLSFIIVSDPFKETLVD